MLPEAIAIVSAISLFISTVSIFLAVFKIQFTKAVAKADAIRALGKSILTELFKIGARQTVGKLQIFGKRLYRHHANGGFFLPDVLAHGKRAARISCSGTLQTHPRRGIKAVDFGAEGFGKGVTQVQVSIPTDFLW